MLIMILNEMWYHWCCRRERIHWGLRNLRHPHTRTHRTYLTRARTHTHTHTHTSLITFV